MSLTKANFRMIDGSVVNVKDWGAVGDAVTDDHAAIQACMDANLNGIIFFPESIYVITDTLVIPSGNQSLAGEGHRSNIDVQAGSFVSGQPMISNIGTSGTRRRNQFIRDLSLFGDAADRLGIAIDMAFTESASFENIWFQFLETRIHCGEDCYLNVYDNLKGSNIDEMSFHVDKSGFNANVFTGCSFSGKGFLMETTDASAAMAGNTFIGCNFEGCVEDLAKNVTGAFTAFNDTSGELSGIMGLSFNGCYWENNDVPAMSLNAGGISGQSFNGIAGVSISGCFATGGANDLGHTKALVFLEAFGVNGISIVGNHFDDYGTALISDFGSNSGWNFEGNNIGKNSLGVPRIAQFRSDGSGTALGGSGGYVKNIGTLVRRELQGLAPPVSGDHIKGDILWNSQPDAGEYEKWICVTAGNPGTWKGVGYIEFSGEYVPVVGGTDGGGYNLDPTANTLAWRRIQDMVWIIGRIGTVSESSANTGHLSVSLPFPVANLTNQADYSVVNTVIRDHNDAGLEGPFWQANETDTIVSLLNVTDGGLQEGTVGRTTAPFSFTMNFFYIAAPI